MNKTVTLCKSLLEGDVLSILNGFTRLHITNIPREIGRSVERKFGVKVDRKTIPHKDKFNNPGYYYEYRLLRTEENKEGIKRMEAYISKITQEDYESKSKIGRKVIHKKEEQPAPYKQDKLF
jgi:hypothetical protein